MARRQLLLSALCALACLGATAPASAKTSRGFVGVADDVALRASSSVRDKDLRTQAGARIGTLRQVFDWSQIERSEGVYDLEAYDTLVTAAAARGIRVLPVLFNPPRFRSSRPQRRARRGVYPPRRNAAMGDFAKALVRRYGPAGSLWTERPGQAKLPIRAWQIWNEPSILVYWASGPSAGHYTKLLRAVGGAIKQEDPRAEILTAGIPQTNRGVSFERFVRGIYRAGGRSAFDTLALHAYARGHRGTIAAAELARRLMNRHRDRRGRIWVTEVGWASGGPKSAFRAGPKGQANRVRGMLIGLARRQRRLRLRGVVYYKWRDSRIRRGDSDYFGLHTGLLTARGKPKPSFFTFRRTARRVAR